MWAGLLTGVVEVEPRLALVERLLQSIVIVSSAMDSERCYQMD
jgi:hypothetical protein